uniref:DNA polymerase epsilon subunit 3 n=1 Tax=Maconellicoccus hirsutus TaxID=177089 RepID=A2I447_MACHI|nr:DNA-directed polymerase, epsilon 3, p17 subunit-like protein [Maconellicoccus hirsutus]
MAECLDDLNLPTTIIARLIKDALPQGVSVTAEAKAAIARAASVFVLYLTNMSNTLARQNSRKRIIPKDIFDSLCEVDFSEFVAPLQDVFERYKQAQSTKKNLKRDSTSAGRDAENDEEDGTDENDNDQSAHDRSDNQ